MRELRLYIGIFGVGVIEYCMFGFMFEENIEHDSKDDANDYCSTNKYDG